MLLSKTTGVKQKCTRLYFLGACNPAVGFDLSWYGDSGKLFFSENVADESTVVRRQLQSTVPSFDSIHRRTLVLE